MDATVAQWPALYHPRVELTHIEHSDPRQRTGYYLRNANDVFIYTLYWTFIFHLPPFVICGIYAFLNLSVPPTRRLRRAPHPTTRTEHHVLHKRHQPLAETHLLPSAPPSATITPAPSRPRTPHTGTAPLPLPLPKPNWRRSRAAFALIVLAVYLGVSLAGALIGAAIVAYILAGLYVSADYNMSTWIPMIAALATTLIGTLGLWPSVIDGI